MSVRYWFLNSEIDQLSLTMLDSAPKILNSVEAILALRNAEKALGRSGFSPTVTDWCEKGWVESLAWFSRSKLAELTSGAFSLPSDPDSNKIGWVEAIKSRRSIRRFPKKSLSKNDWAKFLESIPSMVGDGIEEFFCLYFAVFRVEGLEQGIYRFDLNSKSCALYRPGDFRQEVINILNGMEASRSGVFTLFVVLDIDGLIKKYRNDAILRRAYVACGFWSQRILLEGQLLNLGSLVSPAINDSSANGLLGIKCYAQQAICSIAFGIKD